MLSELWSFDKIYYDLATSYLLLRWYVFGIQTNLQFKHFPQITCSGSEPSNFGRKEPSGA